MLQERKANRLKDFDYTTDRLYFVTACVKDRIYYLGDIEKGKMNLNKENPLIWQSDNLYEL
jgi:hypothetical protein